MLFHPLYLPQAQALTRRLAARHQVLYTVPSPPVAGRTADLYYNPELTPLRGRPEVYVRGSWDRWSKDKADRCGESVGWCG